MPSETASVNGCAVPTQRIYQARAGAARQDHHTRPAWAAPPVAPVGAGAGAASAPGIAGVAAVERQPRDLHGLPSDLHGVPSERLEGGLTEAPPAWTRHLHGERTAPAAVRSAKRNWAIEVMRRHGLRVSGARRLVLECLLVADGPMSAEQIAHGIGGRMLPSDLASVYRNLARLEQIGLVRHVHLGHGPGLYELATAGEREYLTCERCGDFQAVAPRALDEIRASIEREFGYHASFTHFPIVGLCSSCVADLALAEGARRLGARTATASQL